MAGRIVLAACLAALLAICAGCGGGSDDAATTASVADDRLEKLLGQTGMSVCADGTDAGSSGCTEYTADTVECADTSHALDGLKYRRCEIQFESSDGTHLDPVCAALAPSDPQGYSVKPLDVCT
jgi:hypothetical protein